MSTKASRAIKQLGSQFTYNTLAIEGIRTPPFYLSSDGYVVDSRKSKSLFRVSNSKNWRKNGERIVELMNKHVE